MYGRPSQVRECLVTAMKLTLNSAASGRRVSAMRLRADPHAATEQLWSANDRSYLDLRARFDPLLLMAGGGSGRLMAFWTPDSPNYI